MNDRVCVCMHATHTSPDDAIGDKVDRLFDLTLEKGGIDSITGQQTKKQCPPMPDTVAPDTVAQHNPNANLEQILDEE